MPVEPTLEGYKAVAKLYNALMTGHVLALVSRKGADERAPNFDPAKAPTLDSASWPDERLKKVERARDPAHRLDAILVADRMHAVARRPGCSAWSSSDRRPWRQVPSRRAAIFSAVARPAEVMMSRWPA